jgi:GNAT superfamily N-acetyltransferase
VSGHIPEIAIRPMEEGEPEEEGFVAGVWQVSFREDVHRSSQHHPAYRAVKPALKTDLRRQVNTLLAKPGAVVLLATNPEDAQHFLGFIAYELLPLQGGPLIVHYLYVKQLYRRMGVGRALLDAARGTNAEQPIIYTHRTYKGAAFMEAVNALYLPHFAR